LKILVAEDEPEILLIYKLLFGEKGYQVFATKDGNECLDAYTTELKKTKNHRAPFDLVILDYRMPGKNGVEVAKEILEFCPAQELLMVTAYKDQLELHDQKLKKMRIIEKPFDVDDLLSTVSQNESQRSAYSKELL
jgi:CheY-like chemotaxis protein